MEPCNKLTAYSYKADTNETYSVLVGFVTTKIKAQKLTLIPSDLTIIIEPADSYDATEAVANYIEQNALNCHIERIATAEESLTNIISEITEKLKIVESRESMQQEETEKYKKYWLDGVTENDRIKEQVNAIAVLMEGIFPKG